VSASLVFDVVADVLGRQGVELRRHFANLLRTVLDNGRLAALPEIAAQYQALVNARGGVSDALVQSAFPIEPAQLAGVVTSLEKRFGRKLNATVQVRPSSSAASGWWSATRCSTPRVRAPATDEGRAHRLSEPHRRTPCN
jgi:F0F1-type ATP synthase delta subunit